MAVKMIVMVQRKAGLAPAEFRDGYENSHSRIAVRLFGHLWISYKRNYLMSGRRFSDGGEMVGSRSPDEIGFDAISEYVLKDEAALAEMGRIATENFDMIKADEALWFDQTHSWTAHCETIEEDLS
ncbi:MAG: EthD domain-containing protein [Novosphingobium sp.]|nr:EthD domain-containing protein [Novosphingobium sp.]